MIKLKRPTKPVCIDGAAGLALTAKFKVSGESVWNITELKDALSVMSYNKCSFCETPLGTRAASMEVEHFKYKNAYPDDVVTWDNLLPACRRCNGKKGIHDVVKEPMIDPSSMVPRQHIFLERNFYRSKTSQGDTTLEVLEFNADVRFMTDRYKLCLEVNNRLMELGRTCGEIADIAGCRRLRKRFRAILNLGQPAESFAASIATEIYSNQAVLAEIEKCLRLYNLWDAEFDRLLAEIADIVLI